MAEVRHMMWLASLIATMKTLRLNDELKKPVEQAAAELGAAKQRLLKRLGLPVRTRLVIQLPQRK